MSRRSGPIIVTLDGGPLASVHSDTIEAFLPSLAHREIASGKVWRRRGIFGLGHLSGKRTSLTRSVYRGIFRYLQEYERERVSGVLAETLEDCWQQICRDRNRGLDLPPYAIFKQAARVFDPDIFGCNPRISRIMGAFFTKHCDEIADYGPEALASCLRSLDRLRGPQEDALAAIVRQPSFSLRILEKNRLDLKSSTYNELYILYRQKEERDYERRLRELGYSHAGSTCNTLMAPSNALTQPRPKLIRAATSISGSHVSPLTLAEIHQTTPDRILVRGSRETTPSPSQYYEDELDVDFVSESECEDCLFAEECTCLDEVGIDPSLMLSPGRTKRVRSVDRDLATFRRPLIERSGPRLLQVCG
ncbi:hypothetical protein MMC20_001759 [Loxospora ochrophaea]|nr:hypothetical protein [Loxospora ochrophaea]